MSDGRALAAAVAAADLDGRPVQPLPSAVRGRSADELVAGAVAHGLAGLLDAEVAEGLVELDADARDRLADAAREEARRCVAFDFAAARASAALARAGVDHRLLKGSAVAHLDEVDPVRRSYSDVDVLVPADMLPAALGVLAELGYERDLPERRRGFDRVIKDVTLLGPTASIDLHRALALGPFGGTIGGPDLWTRADHVRLAGVDVPTLDAEGRFVHACATAVLGDLEPKLIALRDVALLSRRALDLDRLRALAPPERGAAVVATAVRRCHDELGDVVGDAGMRAAAAGASPSRWERLALHCYRGAGGSNTTELLGVALGLPTWRDRATYLTGLLVPAARYRAARAARGRPSEWRTGLGELVGRGQSHHVG